MESNPEQLVASFMSEYRASGVYSRDLMTRLADLTTAEDHKTAESATRAFFTAFVEQLADSFEPDLVTLYIRAFAQVIHACRRDDRAGQLDSVLTDFGLRCEEDLVSRANSLRQIHLPADSIDHRAIQRVIVLSRVTLGADIAITSVIIERLKHEFPSAEIVLVGGSKTSELFGGDSRVRFREIAYRRTGTTIERLLTWVDLVACVRELTAPFTTGGYLIVDPDSRLTQLGLLPLGSVGARSQASINGYRNQGKKQHDYLFFSSREYGSGTSKSLGQLTSLWLDEVFGRCVPTFPRVSLRGRDIETASKLINRLAHRSSPLLTINFGVGGNPLKRIGGDFEVALVARLIQDGALIVLDKGAGDEELDRADAIIAQVTRIEKDGRRVRAIEIDEPSLGADNSNRLDADVLVWNGRMGMLAALIGASDLYVGYDSAGQHVAAALGVRCIDVFAGFSSARMLDRWRPTGPADTRIVSVDTHRSVADPGQLLDEVQNHAREMIQARDRRPRI